jgi:2-polyprenyl-3-methyl-5-hydroxy-6-metoxy-1,4-benzoquinol methylase
VGSPALLKLAIARLGLNTITKTRLLGARSQVSGSLFEVAVPSDNTSNVALSARQLFSESSLVSTVQRYRPYICPFAELIDQVPSGSNVLDIGCGAGLYLGLLASLGRIRGGVGFDSSPSAIASARSMSQKLAPIRLDFRHLGVDETWPEGEFDVVSLIDVMHHVARPARGDVIRLAVERIRPGGRFIYKDMVRRPLWRAAANRAHDLVMARQWISYEPVEAVETQCRAIGLELVHRDDINMLWYGHELRVFRRAV